MISIAVRFADGPITKSFKDVSVAAFLANIVSLATILSSLDEAILYEF